MTETLKKSPDELNEVHEVASFSDAGRCRVTPVARFAPAVAQAVVDTLTGLVRTAHETPDATTCDADGIVRAQTFEEGDVYMLEAPFDGYFADRYLMDFYDVNRRGICSRMHLHTGLRFVRMMTGTDTQIRVSSLAPFEVVEVKGVTPFVPQRFEDELPDAPDGAAITRYNLVVPENSWIDLQIPRAVSHQFNAIGPNAVIDSVHPEESIETFREKMSGYRMMAQTVFLAEELPDAGTCNVLPDDETRPHDEVRSDGTPGQPAHSAGLRGQIEAVVRETVSDGPDTDASLAGADSLAVVRLLVALEKQFGITIAAQEVVEENFRSLQALCTLVDSHLGRTAGHAG
ncbi:acyl carrier protein [Streptomyces sp. NPDC047043]|uniref:acyl carrier protein n=1 Tax=Streptomyces sp. NPDC047043 TaxID=3154497 RepID=UPI003405A08C